MKMIKKILYFFIWIMPIIQIINVFIYIKIANIYNLTALLNKIISIIFIIIAILPFIWVFLIFFLIRLENWKWKILWVLIFFPLMFSYHFLVIYFFYTFFK